METLNEGENYNKEAQRCCDPHSRVRFNWLFATLPQLAYSNTYSDWKRIPKNVAAAEEDWTGVW